MNEYMGKKKVLTPKQMHLGYFFFPKLILFSKIFSGPFLGLAYGFLYLNGSN